MAENKMRELGGLWLHKSNNGISFMSGSVEVGGEEVPVVIFKNTFKKEGERTPDYRVYLSKKATKGEPKSETKVDKEEEYTVSTEESEDIPF